MGVILVISFFGDVCKKVLGILSSLIDHVVKKKYQPMVYV
jgi:hypothetical protein